MKSYQSSPSTSGSRRGPRRRGEGGSGRYTSDRRNGGPKKPVPKTFWQKIVSFFKPSGKGTGSQPPDAAPARPDDVSKPSRPKREPGSDSGRTARKPEAVEVTSPRLYVGNLSFDAAETDLTELFNGVGQVVTVEVVTHKQTQRSKGFAFVQMQTTDEAKRAVAELHDKEFMGRKLVVSGAKNGDQHDGRSEPRFAV